MGGAAAIDRAERAGGAVALDRAGSVHGEERVPTEAGVPLTAVGIEDPEGD